MTTIRRREFLTMVGIGATEVAVARTARAAEAAADPNQPPGEQNGRTFVSGREDGRFVQTAGFLQASLKQLRPKLAFDSQMKAAAFPVWREAVREKLLELLCFPEDVPQQPEPKKLWTKQRDGYQLQKWEVYPEPLCVVPFLMLVPDGVSQQSPAPVVMCFPGSTASKESLAGEPELDTGMPSPQSHWATNRQALFCAQKGFIAVAVDNPATNETASPLRSRSDMCSAALWMGRNYLGISVFQKACILQWLSSLALVDSKRIAACGHSLGSTPADVLGVLYPELVKAVVHNDFVCNWQERSVALNLYGAAPWHTVPGLFQWFDHTDLEASLAPRPLLFTEGGRANQITKIRQAYQLLNAENALGVFHYAKFATPELRPHDDEELPEGLTMEEYFLYANVDPSKHRFRPERAIPWLARVFE